MNIELISKLNRNEYRNQCPLHVISGSEIKWKRKKKREKNVENENHSEYTWFLFVFIVRNVINLCKPYSMVFKSSFPGVSFNNNNKNKFLCLVLKSFRALYALLYFIWLLKLKIKYKRNTSAMNYYYYYLSGIKRS